MGYKNFNTLNNIGGAYVMIIFFTMLLLTMILLTIVILCLKHYIPLNERMQLYDKNRLEPKKIGSYKIRSYSFLLKTYNLLKDFLFLTAPIRLAYE